MSILLLVVFFVAACFLVAGLAITYWHFLLATFPERLRTEEIYTVTTADLWKLRLCRYRKGRTSGEPVLLVHGMNVNHHNFTIPAEHSLIDYLVQRGYDCWAVDLRGSRSSIPPFERRHRDATLDDYLLYDLPAVVADILRATQYEKLHWIGHSMGGMLLYAYVQKYGAGQIASAVTLGSPVGFRGVRVRIPRPIVACAQRFPETAGTLMRALLPLLFLLRRGSALFPLNFKNIHPNLGLKDLFPTLEMPLPHIVSTMLEALQKKAWYINGRQHEVWSNADKIRVPLLAIYGNKDPFVPLDEARQFFSHITFPDKSLLILGKETGCSEDYSHCDLAFSKQNVREVYEPIVRWLNAHTTSQKLRLETPVDLTTREFTPPLDQAKRTKILEGALYTTPKGKTAAASPAQRSKPRSRKGERAPDGTQAQADVEEKKKKTIHARKRTETQLKRVEIPPESTTAPNADEALLQIARERSARAIREAARLLDALDAGKESSTHSGGVTASGVPSSASESSKMPSRKRGPKQR